MEYKIFLILLSVIFVLTLAGQAFASARETVTVRYHRPEGDYDGWRLWTWNQTAGTRNVEVMPSGRDGFGLFFVIEPSAYGPGDIGLLPKLGDWAGKDDPNRILPYGKVSGLAAGEVFIVSGVPGLLYEKPDVKPFIKAAFLDSPRTVTLAFSQKLDPRTAETMLLGTAVEARSAGKPQFLRVAWAEPVFGGKENGGERTQVFKLTLAGHIRVTGSEEPPEVTVVVPGFGKKPVAMRDVLYGREFVYDGELGCVLERGAAVFRAFAPTASSLEVLFYDGPESPQSSSVPMKRIGAGVWEARIEWNPVGKYYRYRVVIGGEACEAIDPYSRCNTGHAGRALIVDDRTPVADPPRFEIDRAVIYEMHIRDFTIDAKTAVKNRGKFLGVAEEGARHVDDPNMKTGIAHLLELGINTVQILPFQDFENDERSDAYNWGYMPVHYNSPDGWYATDVYGPARVAEAKKMIDAFHANGIKVVMDVVYNHTAESNEMVRYSFNGLAPGYYYRRRPDGSYWNGSGCGNEFKSEAPMGRKFIIDSLKYWVKEYKVDGFRFDLMGLIDTATVCLLTSELKKTRPDIFIYGEPWAAGETPISPTVKGTQKRRGFAVFNDIFRDEIKGSVWNLDGGFVQGTKEADVLARGVLGSLDDFAASPLESINYCEAHDNRTLFDTLTATTAHDRTITEEKIKNMHKIATLLVLTAQGVPFIHSGQEMMRTKFGEENSYNKPDRINRISWDRKIEYIDVFEYTKKLIKLRRDHPMFRLRTADEVRKCVKVARTVPAKCLAFTVTAGDSGDSWSRAIVMVNASRAEASFRLPEGNFRFFMKDNSFVEGASIRSRKGKTLAVAPISASIIFEAR